MAAAKSKKTGDGGGKNPSAAQKKNKKLNSAQATIEKDLKDGKPRAKKIVEKLADEAGVCDTKGGSGGKAASGKKAAGGKSQGKKGKSDGGKAKSDGGKAKSSGKAAGGKAKSDGGKAKSASGKTKSASSGKAAAAAKPAAKKAEGSKAKKADKKTSSGKAAGAKSASGKSQSEAASGKKAAGGKGKSGKSASKKTSSAKADKKKTQQTKSGASMADSKKPKSGKSGKSGKGKSASAKSASGKGKGKGKSKAKKPQAKPMATTTAADQRLRQATGNTSAELAEVGKLAREKAAGKKYRPSGRTRPVQKDPSLNASERRFAKNNDVPIGTARATLKETTKPGHKYQNNPVERDLYRGPTSLARTAGHASSLMANPVDYVKNPVENWKPVVLGVSLTALGYVGMNFIDRGLATMGSGKCDAFHGSDAAARILQKPGALRLGVQLGTSLVAGGGAWWLSMREKEHPYAVAALVGLATGAGTHFLAALLTSYAMPALFKADKWESDKMGSRYYPLEQERFQKGLSKLIDTQTKICESKKLNSDERLDLVFGVVMAAADAPDKLSTQEKAEKFLRVPNHRLFGAGKPQQRQGGNVGVAGAPQDGAPPREKYMPARTPDRMGQQQAQQNQVRQQQNVGVAGAQQQKGAVLPPPPVPGRQAPAVKSGQAPQNKPGHTHPEGQVGVAGCGACSRPAMSAQPSQKRPAWYMVKAGKTTGADGVERTIEAGMWLDAEGHPLYKGPAPMLEEAKKRGAYTFEAASGNYLDEAGNVLFTVPRRNRTNEERAQQPAAQATSKASQRIEVPANAKPVLVKEGGRTFIDFSTEAGASASAAPSGAASAASSAPSASATLNFEKIQQQMERLEAQHQQTKKELVEFAAKNENLAKDNIELRAKIRTYEERLGTGSTEIAAPVARVVSEITPEGPRSVQNDAPSASTPSFRRSDNGRSGLFGRN